MEGIWVPIRSRWLIGSFEERSGVNRTSSFSPWFPAHRSQERGRCSPAGSPEGPIWEKFIWRGLTASVVNVHELLRAAHDQIPLSPRRTELCIRTDRYDKSALAEAASAKYDSGIPSGEENSSN
ncbi:hypothetical protein PHLCEN_2v13469 [Hermanssonia centrifuga]|uniref:Uncharacterized protein n=1 Tax=Hermanssonia centrifuga TaxID=98765 RepID=A0A2R6NE61_9APHY|nr:hypothetical protein PHLCEN_2v13469 [Hermanssonia centrifuga]